MGMTTAEKRSAIEAAEAHLDRMESNHMTHVMLEGRDPAADPKTAHEKVRAARRALRDLRST